MVGVTDFPEEAPWDTLKRVALIWIHCALAWALWLCQPGTLGARQASAVLGRMSAQDAVVVASADGNILYKKNETTKYVPASTLKLLTALAAIHHLGKSYRFHTEFYLDPEQNLKVKGYGDPLLISEVWQEIAESLSPDLPKFRDLVVDDTYFARDISIPGVGTSTNPYDAINGALCANFNTVFFKRDDAGRIVSAETQTPMTPLALKKVRLLGLKAGRYNFSHNNDEAALYAGELFAYFLRERGSMFHGRIRSGRAAPNDKLLYTYRSCFTLEEGLKKMLGFSNNFMANQIFIALGAHVHGPPGDLDKGVQVVSHYAKEVLGLKDITIAEGSGISRKNRLSALDLLAVLKAFEPHRALLKSKGNVSYKSGTLKGVRTRAGFIEDRSARLYYFVVFLNSSHLDMETLTASLAKELDNCRSRLVPQAD